MRRRQELRDNKLEGRVSNEDSKAGGVSGGKLEGRVSNRGSKAGGVSGGK